MLIHMFITWKYHTLRFGNLASKQLRLSPRFLSFTCCRVAPQHINRHRLTMAPSSIASLTRSKRGPQTRKMQKSTNVSLRPKGFFIRSLRVFCLRFCNTEYMYKVLQWLPRTFVKAATNCELYNMLEVPNATTRTRIHETTLPTMQVLTLADHFRSEYYSA